MANTTNVPIPTLGDSGFVAPLDSAVLAGVLADYNAAYGATLNPDPTTPQGQLAASTTALIGYFNALFAQYVSLIDPKYSSGRMQDGIARIYFLDRDPAEPTTVQAVCSGATGTVIPTGALAVATDGNYYSCTTGGAIASSGSVTLPFACVATGPIACAPGSLNQIYRTITGWDSITNPTAGVVGNDEETPAAFETRRAASVALNAVGLLAAVRASVLNVPGVIDAYVTENNTASAVTVQGVSIAAHSLYVAVSGGDLDAVAQAIFRKKGGGCGYTGATMRTVYDTNALYTPPYPSYAVSYTVATPTPIYFAVQLATSATVPSDAMTQISNAIYNRFNGLDGSKRERIAGTIFAGRYYQAIYALGDWVEILSLKIGVTSPGAADELVLNLNQIPTFSASNVTVTLA